MKIMVFDVGGTEIKYSVMDEQMHRTNSGAVPTPQDTQAQFLDAVYRLYAPHKDEVTGIAMALPGFVDNRTGYVSNGGALLYNTATPVGQLLAEKCGCPVILENDGKAAAMAELANGALKDCCNAAVFIIGTGVGGGIIANGQLGCTLPPESTALSTPTPRRGTPRTRTWPASAAPAICLNGTAPARHCRRMPRWTVGAFLPPPMPESRRP